MKLALSPKLQKHFSFAIKGWFLSCSYSFSVSRQRADVVDQLKHKREATSICNSKQSSSAFCLPLPRSRSHRAAPILPHPQTPALLQPQILAPAQAIPASTQSTPPNATLQAAVNTLIGLRQLVCLWPPPSVPVLWGSQLFYKCLLKPTRTTRNHNSLKRRKGSWTRRRQCQWWRNYGNHVRIIRTLVLAAIGVRSEQVLTWIYGSQRFTNWKQHYRYRKCINNIIVLYILGQTLRIRFLRTTLNVCSRAMIADKSWNFPSAISVSSLKCGIRVLLPTI